MFIIFILFSFSSICPGQTDDSKYQCDSSGQPYLTDILDTSHSIEIPSWVKGIVNRLNGIRATAHSVKFLNPSNVAFVARSSFDSFLYLTTVVDFPLIDLNNSLCNGCSSLLGFSFSNQPLQNHTLVIPADVSYIGTNAFSYAKFTKVIFPNYATNLMLSGYVFSFVSSLTSIENFPIVNISEYLFYDCTSLTNFSFLGQNLEKNTLIVPNGINHIGTSSFYSTKFTSIKFESSSVVFSISCFYQMISLSSVKNFPLTNLTDYLFSGCNSLDSFSFVGQTNSITGKLVIPNGVSFIGNSPFSDTLFSSLEFNLSKISLSSYSFYSMKSLNTVINFPRMNITNNLFSECISLESFSFVGQNIEFRHIKFPSEVKLIGYSAFSNTLISTLSFEENIQIEFSASSFSLMRSLTTVINLPKISLPNSLFSDCSSLENLTFVGQKSVVGCLLIPSGLSVGYYSFSGTLFSTLLFEGSSVLTTSSFNSMRSLIQVENFPIMDIPGSLFNGCNSLETFSFSGQNMVEGQIVFPPGVSSVGSNAFYSTLFTTIVFQNSRISLDYNAFYSISSLTSVHDFPLISISNSLFSNCVSLNKFSFYGKSNRTGYLVIPKEITSIGNYAFTETLFSVLVFEGESITLSQYSFNSLPYLNSVVNFPLISIPGATFYGCSSLDNFSFAGQSSKIGVLEIPEGVSSIGQYVFADTLFHQIILASASFKFTSSSFSHMRYLKVVQNFPIIEIPGSCFLDCSLLRTLNFVGFSSTPGILTIPSDITSIGTLSFSNTGFSSIVFSSRSSTISLGYSCFSVMSMLTSVVNFPIISIPADVFYGCSFLDNLSFTGQTSKICQIVIPNGITSIGGYPFSGTAFTSIIFEAINSISFMPSSFSSMKSLTTVLNFPIVNISGSLFYQCLSLDTFSFAGQNVVKGVLSIPAGISSIESSAFSETKFSSIVFNQNSIRSIAWSSFNSISTLTSVQNFPIIPIESSVFSGCSSLNQFSFVGRQLDPGNLVIPSNFPSIGSRAFESTNFSSITFESTIQVLSDSSFIGMRNVQKVQNFPLMRIPNYVFSGCSQLNTFSFSGQTARSGILEIPVEILFIGNNAFSQTKFSTIIFTNSDDIELSASSFESIASLVSVVRFPVVSIPNYLFYGCNSLYNMSFAGQSDNKPYYLIIPGSIPLIGSSAFSGTLFSTIILDPNYPNSLTFSSFSGMTNLKNVENFPIISIPNSIFSGCNSLNNFSFVQQRSTPGLLEFPDFIPSIGTSAFSGLNITTVKNFPLIGIPNSIFSGCSSLNEFSFVGQSLQSSKLIIPNGVSFVGSYAFSSTRFTSIKFDSDVNIALNQYSFASMSSLIEVSNFPLDDIPNYLFSGCSSLRSFSFVGQEIVQGQLNIHPSVPIIGAFAFSDTLFSTIIFNDSFPTMTENQFASMSKLITVVSFPITNVPNSLFRYCSSLSSFSFSGQDLKPGCLVIPQGVVSIGNYAFSSTNFSSIEFPSTNVSISIGYSCFSSISSLSKVLNFPLVDIPNAIFFNCSSLNQFSFFGQNTETGTLDIHPEIFSIQYAAFSRTKFSSVKNFPIISIANSLFEGCSSLSGFSFVGQTITPGVLSIPGDLPFVGSYSFSSTSFSKIVFLGSMTTFGIYSFSSMDSLTSVENFYRKNIPHFIFYGCLSLNRFSFSGKSSTLNKLVIPKEILSIGSYAFSFTRFSSLTFEDSNDVILSSGSFSSMHYLNSVINFPLVPIPDYLFSNCFSLSSFSFVGQDLISSSLRIPSSIRSIDKCSFQSTSFTLITFEKYASTPFFGQSAFSQIVTLEKVTNFPSLISIPETLFFSCSKLSTFATFYNPCPGFHFYDDLLFIGADSFSKTSFSCYTAPSSFDVHPFLSSIKNSNLQAMSDSSVCQSSICSTTDENSSNSKSSKALLIALLIIIPILLAALAVLIFILIRRSKKKYVEDDSVLHGLLANDPLPA